MLYGAADAAMVQEDSLRIEALDQIVVESHLAKLVDQDGSVRHLLAGQETAQQGGLATPRKSRNDSGSYRHPWYLPLACVSSAAGGR